LASVPVVKVGSILIATLHEDLTDDDALGFQDALNGAIERVGATGVLLDVSLVATIDSFLGRLLFEIASGARLLGAATVVAGIRPAVAMTLVELGLDLQGIRTVLTPERGLALLNNQNRGLHRGG
jgi:rsbT antagonist protein RsbS